jgi:hypothetical protein
MTEEDKSTTKQWLGELQELVARMQASYINNGALNDDMFIELHSMTMTFPRPPKEG